MPQSRTVGLNGDNEPDDVRQVQQLLSAWLTGIGSPALDVTGSVDFATTAAIGAFEVAQGASVTGLLHVVDSSVSLAQGQGEGDTIAEACNAAREACKAAAVCAPGKPLKMGKCTCWRGGTQEWTCLVQCGCLEAVA